MTKRHIILALLFLTALVALIAASRNLVGSRHSVADPLEGHILCVDGTLSASCTEPGPGCCAHHGGVAR